MTSLDKSLLVDYYRESPDNVVCVIGQCDSDADSIFSSDVGINLKNPKNMNTILCHYYSPLANLLSIKKIIREGRSIKENHLLMGISISIYTLIINSYIVCCFMRRRDIIQGQLNFLEVAFLFLSISAFSSKADVSDGTNLLMQNRKLYIWHYIFQILGLVILKSLGIYFFTVVFKSNDFIGLNEQDSIYATFYFIFCIEQLFSTIFVLNLICFYRQSWQLNASFIVISLIIFLYFVIVLTLNNSNFNVDIFNILHFEFLENIVDAYDENNKLECFYICLIDISVSIVYSNIIYYVFDYLSKNKSKDESNKINSENNNGKE
jgi:magnesium-transporting ATPase (P-type)